MFISYSINVEEMKLYLYALFVVKIQNISFIFISYLLVKLVMIFELSCVCDNVMMDIVMYRHAMVIGVAWEACRGITGVVFWPTCRSWIMS